MASPTWIVSSGAFWSAGTSGLMSDGSDAAYSARASATPTGMNAIEVIWYRRERTRYPNRIDVANATENSNRLPHGPRPTMTPRTTIEPARSANAATVSQRDGRESGEGAAKSAGPDAATAARDSTNEPVATPAQAGLGALIGASTLARERRPFASSTACPIAAANAKTSTTVPIANSAWVSASMSGRGGASGRRADRSQRRHRVVDLQDEAARAARVDEC